MYEFADYLSSLFCGLLLAVLFGARSVDAACTFETWYH